MSIVVPVIHPKIESPLFCPSAPACLPTDTDATVDNATPSVLRAGGIVPRRRFQRGMLRIRGSRNPQRTGMYREDVVLKDGTIHRVQREITLGPVKKLSERAAWAMFQPYLDRVNSTCPPLPPKGGMTLETFVEEWRSNVAVNLAPSSVRAAESHLRTHLIPMLGKLTLTGINTKLVQAFVTSRATLGLKRKTIENVLLTLSSILNTAKAWDYRTGNFVFGDLTLPREGVKEERRSFTPEEVGRIIRGAREPFATIWSVVAMTGLRVSEALGLRVCDIDLERKIVRIRQSVDSHTRKVQGCKSEASEDDLPLPPQLEARLQRFLDGQASDTRLLFVNRNGRPYSANKLREKQLHPLLKKLGIPHGGFHGARHGMTSELLEAGASPAVVQRQMRHSDPRITLGIYGHVVGNAHRSAVEEHAKNVEKYAVN
jgi:integrase